MKFDFISFIVEVKNYEKILSQMYNGERFSDKPDAYIHQHEDFEMVDTIVIEKTTYFFFKVGGNLYTAIGKNFGKQSFRMDVRELRDVYFEELYGKNFIVIPESKLTKLTESEFNDAHNEILKKFEVIQINSKNPELTRELLSLPAWIAMDNPENIIENTGDQFISKVVFKIGRLHGIIIKKFLQNHEVQLFFDNVKLYTGTTRGTEYIGEWHHSGDWQFDIMNDIKNLKDEVQAKSNKNLITENKAIKEILSKY